MEWPRSLRRRDTVTVLWGHQRIRLLWTRVRELRQGVFVRENLIYGDGCVLGNSREYKNALLFGDVETAHFNDVGDSILGNGAHLGAGTITLESAFRKTGNNSKIEW